MKKISLYVFFVLVFGNFGFAMDNWKIEQVLDNKFTQVSTHGTVTYGDKYTLHILNNGKCNIVEDGFTFYTTSNHPDILYCRQGNTRSNEH